ncbi:MAG TPA: single-stranded DNA-binding protein [Amycolatopsis sp.]|nr:single-stranded DNA-binding protein [Amycolatopsis sp.]
MAIGETPVTLVGTVYTEPESTRVGEHDVVSFWLLSKERRLDREQGAWVDGRKLVARVKCRRRLAAGVLASLRKGDPVIVTGRLYICGEGEGGETRPVPEVEASAVGPNLMRCVAPAQRGRRTPGAVMGGGTRPPSEPSAPNPLVGAAEPVAVG